MKKIITGIQPSNKLTLGNYLGVMKNIVNFQDESLMVFIADLHAITNVFDAKMLAQNTKNMIAFLIASGLDLNKTKLFVQSQIKAVTTLGHVLLCHTTIGELNRMTQFKDKSAKVSSANGTDFIPTGLFTYPALMAADILLYDAQFVPVGSDQKQHIELTRNIATRFNNKYGETFVVPEPIIPEVGARIMDLSNPLIKMSKSNPSEKGIIYLLDDPEVAAKKIMSAKTDGLNQIKFDYEQQPGLANLISIYAAMTNMKINQVVEQYQNSSYGDFKKALSLIIKNFLIDLQAKYYDVINHFDDYLEIIKKQTSSINEQTDQKLKQVLKKIGIYQYEK